MEMNKPRANQVAHYFDVVYDVAMQYVQRLRANEIMDTVFYKTQKK